VPRSTGHVIHPYLNLDARLRYGKLTSERRDQHGCRFNGIRYLFSPGSMLGLRLIVQPDLHSVAIILFADGGKQVRELKPFKV